MVDVVRSATFDRWLRTLKDRRAAARVLGGISGLRIDYGPGYRVYYLKQGDRLILLLCGGDKSTQDADIRTAHHIAQQWHTDQRGHP